jgi:hypothetical protein
MQTTRAPHARAAGLLFLNFLKKKPAARAARGKIFFLFRVYLGFTTTTVLATAAADRLLGLLGC